MADSPKNRRIPVAVLEKARKLSVAPKPPPAPAVKPAKHPREKIVAALKKLHPMD
ncbi:MAG: hypothetical protein WBV82_12895 [Myxococcaceae bacterium]